jgi:hypothetical protein
MDAETKKLIAETWDVLGVKGVRPLGRTLFVRTEAPPQKTESGLLWLPPKVASFYGGLPHQRLVIATVLSAGPKAFVQAGDRVCFMRLHFARWHGLGEDQYVGWIDESQIFGYYEGRIARDEPCAQPQPQGVAAPPA